MGRADVGVVYVILRSSIAIVYVMGGLESKITFNVPIWSIDAQENEVRVV
jgi:hypothetical protein